MKKTNRILSLVLTLALLFTMAVPVGVFASPAEEVGGAGPRLEVDNDWPVVGETITAILTPRDPDATYQWWTHHPGAGPAEIIEGATGKEFEVTEDVAYYELQVTATLGDGTEISQYGYTNEVEPSLTIDNPYPRIGDTITAELRPADPAATFQWYRMESGNAVPIDGATNATYEVVKEDCGSQLQIEVEIGDTILICMTDEEISRALIIDNMTPQVGQTIRGDIYPQEDILSCQWRYFDGSKVVDIAGATNQEYLITAGDLGREIYFEATTASGEITSPYTEKVAAADAAVLTVDIPDPKVGKKITAIITPADAAAKYQWFLYGGEGSGLTPISGATEASFVPGQDHVGYKLSVSAILGSQEVITLASHTDRVGVECNSGNHQTYAATDPGKKPIGVTFSGGISQFNNSIGVEKDGEREKLLEAGDYTVTADAKGILVTLNTSYLDTLEEGKYFLYAYYKSGIRGEADFAVAAGSPITKVGLDNQDPVVGEDISVSLTPRDATADISWYATDENDNETIIPGATAFTYNVAPQYVGCTITARAVGTGDYSGDRESDPTAVVQAECIAGRGQGYNILDPARHDLKFRFNGDPARINTMLDLTLVYPDGAQKILGSDQGSIEKGTSDVTLYKDFLDTLAEEFYVVEIHYLGGAMGTAAFEVVNSTLITDVLIGNTKPRVGDELKFTATPENTPMRFAWYRTMGDEEGEEIAYTETYKVKEDDVGFRIYLKAWAMGSTMSATESNRTEPAVAICTQGEGASYKPGENLRFTFNGALRALNEANPVTVAPPGGKEAALKRENYTLESGSTIVTLKDAYLKTLAPGNYILAAHYHNDVKAEALFTIEGVKPTPAPTVKPTPAPTVKPTPAPTVKPTPSVKPDEQPKTGDNTNLWLWVLLATVALGGFGTVLYLRNKQRQ
ncbi:MAG: hypothetical protein RSC76_03635 [Oscillospiraceae bacterium]